MISFWEYAQGSEGGKKSDLRWKRKTWVKECIAPGNLAITPITKWSWDW